MDRTLYTVSALCLLSIGTISNKDGNVVKYETLSNYFKKGISVVTFAQSRL
jgi:hypothetical protein